MGFSSKWAYIYSNTPLWNLSIRFFTLVRQEVPSHYYKHFICLQKIYKDAYKQVSLPRTWLRHHQKCQWMVVVLVWIQCWLMLIRCLNLLSSFLCSHCDACLHLKSINTKITQNTSSIHQPEQHQWIIGEKISLRGINSLFIIPVTQKALHLMPCKYRLSMCSEEQ